MNVAIIVVILILFLYWQWGYLWHTTPIISQINKKAYRVASGLDDHEKASDLIAQLDQFAGDFITKLRAKYGGHQDSEMGAVLTRNLVNRYRGGSSIYENHANGSTSFTNNKGETIAMCLRQKVPPYELHDINLLKYVFLHELTHVAMTGADARHSMTFWQCFKFMLNEATVMGLYTPQNFKAAPQTYCGLRLEFNPVFDLLTGAKK